MKKFALFVFNGDPMCFIHVLLNALDMKEKALHKLWEKVKEAGLVDGVCKACSNKLGTLEAAKEQGLTLLDEMSGHPSMARYLDEGFEIISF